MLPILPRQRLFIWYACLAAAGLRAIVSPCAVADQERPIAWRTDYLQARAEAAREGKMLFIYFQDPQVNPLCTELEHGALNDAKVRQKLSDCVCVRVPLDATIPIEGKPLRILDHPSMSEMLGKPGIAIVDFAHSGTAFYATVVSTFPLLGPAAYTPAQLAVMLDLPPGTLTQRTLIYAVRVHPEQPASTRGAFNAYLAEEAQGHSQYQADIRVQGHHRWDARFQRIVSRLQTFEASEVCAESWPNERLLVAAIDCVSSWRQSPGHWHGVSSYHPQYAYDMKLGSNGIWYATGIFAEAAAQTPNAASRTRP